MTITSEDILAWESNFYLSTDVQNLFPYLQKTKLSRQAGPVSEGQVLPERLLKEVQKYAAGETLYFPKDEERKKWGALTGSRVFFQERNADIRMKYLQKTSIEHLANEYHLSVETIRKIVFNTTPQQD
ncbi:MAG: CD3324 family protein [Oscillospiraceae bacterium]|nr:CD3324 family protein [Oscillospiraceae bacterium]